jgi:hypothetical protein
MVASRPTDSATHFAQTTDSQESHMAREAGFLNTLRSRRIKPGQRAEVVLIRGRRSIEFTTGQVPAMPSAVPAEPDQLFALGSA